MKTIRTLISAAVVATFLLPSCSKQENAVPQTEEHSVISARILQPGDEAATKTWLGAYESGKGYPVLWSSGDSVALSIQGSGTFCPYALTSGQNTMRGIFEPMSSTVISSGSVYAYYPYKNVTGTSGSTFTVTIPEKQALLGGSFGKGSMPMCAKADDISTDSLFFKPLMSVLKIRVKGVGSGIGTIISRIIIKSDTEYLSGTATVDMNAQTLTMTGGKKKVELRCSVTLSAAVDSFLIAIPAATSKNYTIQLVTSTGRFIEYKATGKSFEVQKIKRMAVQEFKPESFVKYEDGAGYTGDAIMIGDIVWAPQNCGYNATNYPYGRLYQFGRTAGHGYYTTDATHAVKCDPSSTSPTVVEASAHWTSDGCNKGPEDNNFYKNPTDFYDWYTGTSGKQLSEWPMTAPSGTTGIGNPCPSGWRVPTEAELSSLKGNYSGMVAEGTGGLNGRWFTGPEPYSASGARLFLPAAGHLDYGNGVAYSRGTHGHYWSASVSGTRGRGLYFVASDVGMDSYGRAYGFSVRCVQK